MRPGIAARLATLATAVTLTTDMALAQVSETPTSDAPFYRRHEMMWGGDHWGGFGMILGPILMMLIVLLTVAGIVYLVRLFGGPGVVVSAQQAQDPAMALLKERFAKGEIDRQEFEERKKLLAD